jgi:ABC-type glycerol-3-phosphate transport system substrate-binding protein
MKERTSPFQMIMFGFLVFAIIAGVIVFSLRRSSSEEGAVPVTAWGTIPAQIINELSELVNDENKDSIDLTYVEYSAFDFEDAFVEALASGEGPDILFISSDSIVEHENKLYEIGYEFYPQKTFEDTFIEAGDVLVKESGVIGIPFMIDPLVMYWNRNMLNAAGIAAPPKFWDQLFDLTPRLSQVDNDLNVIKSAISLGEFRNIDHAKEILITLINQSGNPVVTRNLDNNTDKKFDVLLDERLAYPTKPAEASLNFYTQFSNPTLNTYTWNRSLPRSREMFLAGDLAFYIGYASEFLDIQRQNPNLNFSVSTLPQSRSNDQNVSVNAKMIFAGLAKNSSNISAAFSAISKLTTPEIMSEFSRYTNLPPVRRDLLLEQNNNSTLQVFYDSALIARPFLDPGVELTDKIFSDMVESYTSGRSTVSQVLLRAQNQLINLFD